MNMKRIAIISCLIISSSLFGQTVQKIEFQNLSIKNDPRLIKAEIGLNPDHKYNGYYNVYYDVYGTSGFVFHGPFVFKYVESLEPVSPQVLPQFSSMKYEVEYKGNFKDGKIDGEFVKRVVDTGIDLCDSWTITLFYDETCSWGEFSGHIGCIMPDTKLHYDNLNECNFDYLLQLVEKYWKEEYRKQKNNSIQKW